MMTGQEPSEGLEPTESRREPAAAGLSQDGDVGYALVVGDPDDALTGALSEAVPIVGCPGTAATRCPAAEGDVCMARDGARVTIVFVAADDDEERRLTCVGHSDHPVVSIIDGVDLPARVFGRFGVVGSGAGALGVLAAVSGVIEEDVAESAPHSARRRTPDQGREG